MRYMQRRHLLSISLAVLAAYSGHAMAQVYKCVDPVTKKITFSGTGCASTENTSVVNVTPTNSMESSQYTPPADVAGQSSDYEPDKPRRKAVMLSDRGTRDRANSAECQEAMTPHPGSRGLTKAQRAYAAQVCGHGSPAASLDDSDEQTKAPIPAPSKSPAIITSCDAAGCWDSNGVRYNKGAGATHFPSNGGHACQLINGQMICP